jgi:hypothetical protein
MGTVNNRLHRKNVGAHKGRPYSYFIYAWHWRRV